MTLSNNLFLNLFRRPGQLFRDGLANYQGCRRKSLLLQPGREVGVEAAAGGLKIRRARDRHHQGEVILALIEIGKFCQRAFYSPGIFEDLIKTFVAATDW